MEINQNEIIQRLDKLEQILNKLTCMIEILIPDTSDEDYYQMDRNGNCYEIDKNEYYN